MDNAITTLQSILDSDPSARSDVRRAAKMRGSSCPIVVVAGTAAPAHRGQPPYHTTPSGKTIVRHPRAYGWRTVYHPSTRRIEVGVQWLESHGYLAASSRLRPDFFTD